MQENRLALYAIPSSPTEFGNGLRALRTVGLLKLARRQEVGPGRLVLSKSQLFRYEQGVLLPSLTYAEHLDELYEAEGWVKMSLRTLWRPKWNPWREDYGVASYRHAVDWPAPYRGMVWIQVKPLPENVGLLHRFILDWGPWTRLVQSFLSSEGVVLVTGKAPDGDGYSKTCNFGSNHKVFTIHGAGDVEDEAIIDIRQGWRLRDAE